MSVMRCNCGRTVDLDYRCEDWEGEQCACCAEAEEELQQQAARAAEDDE